MVAFYFSTLKKRWSRFRRLDLGWAGLAQSRGSEFLEFLFIPLNKSFYQDVLLGFHFFLSFWSYTRSGLLLSHGFGVTDTARAASAEAVTGDTSEGQLKFGEPRKWREAQWALHGASMELSITR